MLQKPAKKNIAIISTIQPETHYTRYLYQSLKHVSKNNLRVLVDYTPENIKYSQTTKDPNIVPLWKSNFFLPFTLFSYALKNKITTIHLQHEFNMYGGVKGVPIFITTLILFRIAKIHTITTIHAVVDSKDIDKAYLSTFGLSRFTSVLPLVKLFFHFFYILVGLFSSKIIVHSKFTKKVCLNRYHFNKKNIHVIPIGIAEFEGKAKIPKAKWYSSIRKQKFILYFGYLVRRKGLEILLEAFSEFKKNYPKVKLVLAGGSLPAQKNYINNLKKLVKKYKLSNTVIFTGFISADEINFLYQNCDYVVLPYTHSISSSLPLSLAFQNRKTIIASDVGTLRDEIKPEKNGLLFKNKNSQDFYRQMNKLSGNKSLLKKLSNGAKKEALNRTWDHVATLTYKLYR